MTIVRGNKSTLGVTGSGTSITTAWSSNPTAGSKVLVAVQFTDSSSFLTVTDNGTTPSTFTLDASATGSGSASQVYIYRADGISLPGSGSYTVTVTSTATAHTVLAYGIAYTGVATGGPTSSQTASGTSTSVSSGTVTPAASGALFFSTFFDATGLNPETITLTGSGFTSQATETNGSSFWAGAVADKIDSGGPTATACTWTLGDSVAWNAGIVVYDAAMSTVTGTGSEALAPLAFSGSGGVTDAGTGSLALAPLAFSGTNKIAGPGHLALAPLAMSGTGVVSRPDKVFPHIQILVDWVNNPIGADAVAGNNWTDISDYVRIDQGVTITRGRQDNISAVQPGRCTFTVTNDDGRFTPGFSGSPYAPGVILGRRVQVNVLDENGVFNTRFDGQIAEFDVVDTPTGEDTLMRVICADALAFLNRYPGFSCWTVQECLNVASPALQYIMNEPANSGWLTDSSGNSGPSLAPFTYVSPPFTTIATGGSNAFLSTPAFAYQSGNSPVEGAIPPTVNPGYGVGQQTSTVSSPLPSVNFSLTMNQDTGANTQATAAPSSQFQGFLPDPLTVGSENFTLLGWVWPDNTIMANPYNSVTHEIMCLANTRTGVMLSIEAANTAGVTSYRATLYPNYMKTSATGTSTSGFSSTSLFLDNAPFMVALVVSGTTAKFYIGGNLFGIGASLLSSSTNITLSAATAFNLLSIGGPIGGGNGWAGNISLVNVYDTALTTTQLTDLQQIGAQGSFQQSTGGGFTRVAASYTGLPSYWTGTFDNGLSRLDYTDITGSNPATVMQTISQVEESLFFVDAAGRVNFHDRSRRMGAAAPVLTLPAGSYNVGLQPKINDQYLTNYEALQNQRGGQGVVALNQASNDRYGAYANGSITSPQTAPYITWAGGWTQRQVAAPTSTQLAQQYGSGFIADAASWDVNTMGEPAMKLAAPTVDMLGNLSGSEYVPPSALFAVEINQAIAIGHNLDWWPDAPESSELFVEGVSESYSDKEGTIGFNTSPATQGRAWIPGDSTYGQLDTTARVGVAASGVLADVYNLPVPNYTSTMNSGAGSNGYVGARDQAGIYGNLKQQLQPPLMFVQQVVNAQSLVNGTAGFIVWDTTLIDTVQAMNRYTNGATSSVIIVPGWYEICVTVAFAASSAGRRDVVITQNQTGSLRTVAPASCLPASSGVTGLSTSAVIWCGQGDAIAAKAYQDSGGALNTDLTFGGSHMSLRFLGSGGNRN